MIEDIKQDAEQRMSKSIEALGHELAKLRTGRAHPSLLDHVLVSYYGSDVPIAQVANVNVSDPQTLTVTPWERTMVAAVDKAIRSSDLGLNPATSGNVIRVPMPPLTEDRRRDLVRVVRQEGEQAKVAIRNIRRDANHRLKDLLKEKEITKDEERAAGEAVQKLTNDYIARVDKALEEKEADLMEL
jgi:ribosome recycling factor